MLKIDFIDIGRDKMTWSHRIDPSKLCSDILIDEIKRMGALGSTGITFKQYKHAKHKYGVFVGVVRHVGYIELSGF